MKTKLEKFSAKVLDKKAQSKIKGGGHWVIINGVPVCIED